MSNGIYDYVDDVKKRLAEEYQQIADLEKQLAEKDEEIKKLVKNYDELNLRYCKEMDKVIDLNNQIIMLKENQYTKVEQMQSTINGYLNVIKSQHLNANQKAIEQLEEVKNIILNERKITSFKFDTFNKGKDTALFWLNEQINQQINELKEKWKNKDIKDFVKQNQKAIELLQELLEKTQTLNLMVKSDHYVNEKRVNVVFEDIIIQKLNELKGDNDDRK